MAQTVKHAKVSGVPDGSDVNQIQPSNWNADHVITGTVAYSEISGKPATFPPTLPIAESDVTNLVADLAAKAPLASPALTGDPTAPTPATADNDTSIATTAHVQANMALKANATHTHAQSDVTNLVTDLAAKAPLASPALTGTPTAPTPTAGDNDTSIATTAFVTTAVAGATIPLASTTEVLTGTNTTKAVTPDTLAALWEKGADVGAAATLALGEGGFFNVIGTAAISMITFGSAKTGHIVWLTFISAGSTLVPGSGLSLPGGVTITTQSFDRACFVYYNVGSVICLAYTRVDGKPIAGGASVTISDTAPSSPDPGALWWESDTGKLMIYYNDGNTSQWVEASAAVGMATAASVPFNPTGNIAATNVQAAIAELDSEKIRQVVIQKFTASGTYTPTPGMKFCIVEAVGGGGGGGAASGHATYSLAGGGGGSGGYSRSRLTEAQIGASKTVTIGAAGDAGVPGVTGPSAGGATSLGSLVVANGAGASIGASTGAFPAGGNGGAVGTGDFAVAGNPGEAGFYSTSVAAGCGNTNGGASVFGGAGRGCGPGGGAGEAARGHGSGGGGGGRLATAGDFAGGQAQAGVVVITEFVA